MCGLIVIVAGLHLLQLSAKILDLAVAEVHELVALGICEMPCLEHPSHVRVNLLLNFIRELVDDIFIIPSWGCPTEKAPLPVEHYPLEGVDFLADVIIHCYFFFASKA
jgi:hypothetical protein